MMYLRVYIKWQHLIIGIDIVGHQVVAWCPQVFRKVLRLKNKELLNMLFASANIRNEPKLQGYLLDLVLMEQGNVI